jgi:hypothetical protein
MGQSNKFKGIGSITPFETIAFGYGMTAEYADEVLNKEFSRLHKGSDHRNFILRWTWETLREMRENKSLSDNQIKFQMLPMFEDIIFDKKNNITGKEWAKIVDKANKTRTAKVYENRIKVITSRIKRVDNKAYKNWLSYYELTKPLLDTVKLRLQFNGPPKRE